jgi:hypothetical protein
MSTKLDDLDPTFLAQVRPFLAALDAAGIKYSVTETRRSFADQKHYFKVGTSKCDGLVKLSLHQAGLAIDVVPVDAGGNPSWDYVGRLADYRRIAEIARANGLESGQDWTPLDPKTGLGWDPPHYQMKA